jgi:hypothetical protein
LFEELDGNKLGEHQDLVAIDLHFQEILLDDPDNLKIKKIQFGNNGRHKRYETTIDKILDVKRFINFSG